ncbi:MAG TPA: TonB-dependent receptor plug domain-containing protein, partial [Kofleriaceae bacterium]|nr:TonB-dependent receptor plug domain-containing protein [Kofleriaceae bacterium]
MRARSQPKAPGAPGRSTRQVAQAANPDQTAPEPDPSADKPGQPAAASAEATGEPAQPTQPSLEQSADLSDAEFAKLAEQSKEEVIIVTGSTIGRKTLTTPAPLTVLNRESLIAAGRSTVGDIIQFLPAQTNGINAQTNNGGDGSTRVDIRGLGNARTLTLINGRRVVPSGNGANSSVDVNTIPLAVIDRVEVLKDGASAVYGSDAIGGVVNIITRTDFDGTEAALYTAATQHGDGFTYDASFVTGHNAENKKGNIMFSAGLQSQGSVMAGDRKFSEFDKTFDFAKKLEVRGGSTSIPGGRINTLAIDTNGDGKIGDGKTAPVDVAPTLCGPHPTDPKAEDPNQFCTRNGPDGWRPYATPDDNYNFQPVNYLYTPSSRYNVYSAGTYKLMPEVSTFFEASYLNRTSDQQLAPEPFSNQATISKDSIYNNIGGDVIGYQRRLEEFGPRRSLQTIDTFRIVGGFQG